MSNNYLTGHDHTLIMHDQYHRQCCAPSSYNNCPCLSVHMHRYLCSSLSSPSWATSYLLQDLEYKSAG